MKTQEILDKLKTLGNNHTKKILMRHGAKEPFFGVSVKDLKLLQKQIKSDHELALELFDTGNSDAMYLAGLISEPQKMTREELQNWAKKAYWYYLSEYTVAWTAAESKFGWDLALEWIQSGKENIASTGWATLSSLIAIKQDEEINLKKIEELLNIVARTIQQAKNREKYTMNGFVIAVGTYVRPLLGKAKVVADKIGKVYVEMNGTACKVPLAKDYITKIENKNRVGQKRKTAFC